MRKTTTIITLTLLLFTSCEALFSNLLQTDTLGKTTSTVEIPKGWSIDKDSDYSNITWEANFEISEDGNSISFTDSKGIPVTIVNGKVSLTISEDKPKALFKENKIELKIRDLNLVFVKSTNTQSI